MTVGIARFLIRSSPTCGHFLGPTVHLAHVHTLGPSVSNRLDTMLAKAKEAYDANTPAHPKTLAKQLFPSSSPSSSNADIRDQLKKPGFGPASARTPQPLSNLHNARSTNATPSTVKLPPTATGRLASLYSAPHTIRQEPKVIDLTKPDAFAKAKEAVFFAEDDFSDDDNLDLDYEAPIALPNLPSMPASKPISFNSMPPPLRSTQSEVNIPWSSSPAHHFLHPTAQNTILENDTETSLKRVPSEDQDPIDSHVPKKAKRRVLPASFRQDDPDDEDQGPTMQTPVRQQKVSIFDASASALKEQKKQLKHQRQQKEDEAEQELDSPLGETRQATKSKMAYAPISLSDEQRHVMSMVVDQGRSVFFTGPAGTGKSVLMRAIISELKNKYAKDPERVAVTASTGLAACNIGGITLHSFSGNLLRYCASLSLS
ncbi:hypothetical protein EDB81DRAFT_513864 [Dactylonectria macrodidyma]|uniref:ATP-dependent DNA helicase n=1 Tax=Dactylonectria macrodidyma TaxID=307937 RepID=A0A9P9ESV4_9HYPO|nr:hypothetical protein EDB81DRAFT_513864 [Dactylonectria macrodidyma]